MAAYPGSVLHSSETPLVGVVMGSDSDWRVMSEASQALTDFGIPHEVEVVSAHRTPVRLLLVTGVPVRMTR